MVDLHQTEPGLPEGHPWLAFSRWDMAWRAGLAVGVVTASVLVALNLFVYGTSEGEPPNSGLMQSLCFALIASASAGILAALLGSRLRRYYPFTQALLFGGLVVAAMLVLALVLGIVEDLGRVCESNTLCTPQTVALPSYFALLFGFPVFLAAAVGYGVAIWASHRLRRHRRTAVRP